MKCGRIGSVNTQFKVVVVLGSMAENPMLKEPRNLGGKETIVAKEEEKYSYESERERWWLTRVKVHF